jgi:hypothetical protein
VKISGVVLVLISGKVFGLLIRVFPRSSAVSLFWFFSSVSSVKISGVVLGLPPPCQVADLKRMMLRRRFCPRFEDLKI